MNNNLVAQITKSQIRTDLPKFVTGDTIKVNVRIIEGGKSRIQVFQGVVIARRGSGVGETFIVRKMSSGIGVERTFPVNSPSIASIEVLKHGKVRRKKIYFLRERSGKSARLKEVL
jgi:large subunit ribosomal protein L19